MWFRSNTISPPRYPTPLASAAAANEARRQAIRAFANDAVLVSSSVEVTARCVVARPAHLWNSTMSPPGPSYSFRSKPSADATTAPAAPTTRQTGVASANFGRRRTSCHVSSSAARVTRAIGKCVTAGWNRPSRRRSVGPVPANRSMMSASLRAFPLLVVAAITWRACL